VPVTYNTPTSPHAGMGQVLWLTSLLFVGVWSMMDSVNYMTTIINMRAPGMTLLRKPTSIWSTFITAILQATALPVLTVALILQLLDKTIGTTFFNSGPGCQQLLWGHLFWFYSHPVVYVTFGSTTGGQSDVEETIRLLEEHDCGEVSRLIARDKQAILDKLRQYAPRPSRKARQEFERYRLEREAEAKRQREEIEAFCREQARTAEEQRRRQQEAAARAAQERQWQEQWRAFEEMERQYRGANSAADPCWAVLGLPPTANVEQLKVRYRKLAFQHHTDRGGDGATFQRLQEAYYQALKLLGAS
jgi:hypothetical protein